MSEAPNETPAGSTQSTADSLYNEQKPATETPPAETPPVVDPPATETPPAESAKPSSETPPAEEKPPEETPAADDKTKKPDDKKVDDKGDQTKDKNSPPEKYDLKLPANSPVDPSRLEKIAAEAKAKGLSQEQAQELVEREHTVVNDLVESHNAKVQTWLQESTNDKEIGGPDINRNIELAKRVVDTYGSPLLKQYLDASGFGQHPELLRLFVRIGKAHGEDRLVRGGGNPQPAKKSAADLLFGEGTEEQQT